MIEVEPRADLVEPLADRLALEVAVVDPLEDHRELEVGQRQVQVHVARLAGRSPRCTPRRCCWLPGQPGLGDVGDEVAAGEAPKVS